VGSILGGCGGGKDCCDSGSEVSESVYFRNGFDSFDILAGVICIFASGVIWFVCLRKREV